MPVKTLPKARFGDSVLRLYKLQFVDKDMVGYISAVQDLPPATRHIIRGLMWKDSGTTLFRGAVYPQAREAYLKAIRFLLDMPLDFPLPTTLESLEVIPRVKVEEFLEIVACVNNIAQCYVKEDNKAEALIWLQEVEAMYLKYSRAHRIANKSVADPWKDYFVDYEEYTVTRTKSALRQATIFIQLGNTAAAYDATQRAQAYTDAFITHYPREPAPNVRTLKAQCNLHTLTHLRHPDAPSLDTVQVTEPALQIRGAWKKIRIPGAGPRSRLAPISVVHKGTYYAFGGKRDPDTLRDGWAINLRDVSTGWRRVATPQSVSKHTTEYNRLLTHEGKAYLFQGSPKIPVFDFAKEKWSTIYTHLEKGKSWQDIFPSDQLEEYVAEMYEGKLYVFGGIDRSGSGEQDLFMCLDLETRTWTVLSGSKELDCHPDRPGPRSLGASWIEGGKFYVGFGGYRQPLGFIKNNSYNGSDYHYRDLWGWDLAKGGWSQEKFAGNGPCPRTEVGYKFNEKWNHGIIFGGYNSNMLHVEQGKRDGLAYSYYAETFLWSAESRRWSQVITRDFPTYRASTDLFVDQETGRTYLFGGYASAEYAMSSTGMFIKTFNDIWELTVDLPGSDFDVASFEISDPRFSKLGPWRRCFHCSALGRWMVCAGSCKQTENGAAFCGMECMHAGWASHKKLNGCRKV